MLLALLLCYSGFTGLCLSMDRHHAELLGYKPTSRRRQTLKLAGWLLLVASPWTLVTQAGWGLGLVEWSGVLMLSGLALVLMLPYQPRLVLAMAGLSVLAVPVAVLAQ